MENTKIDNKDLLKLENRMKAISNGNDMNFTDDKEYLEIKEYLSGMSIERIKKKGGEYDYFVADNDGNQIKKFDKEYYDFENLVDGFYECAYMDSAEEFELKTIINNSGNVVIEGIRKIIWIRRDYYIPEFILELETKFHKDWVNKLHEKRKLDLDFTIDKPLICVINAEGGFVIEPSPNRIRFDVQSNEYIIF